MNSSKTRFLSALVVLMGLLLLFGCNPEEPGPNPGNYELYVGDQDKYPAFSPDGQYIAYYHFSSETPQSKDYPTGLYIIDKEGDNRQLILEGDHRDPDWSPNGGWLVFSSGGLIQKCTILGDSLTTFEGFQSENNSFEDALFAPNWSSDGSTIIFDRAVNIDGESNLFSVNEDFTDPIPIYGNIVMNARDPELSPLGNKFIYMKYSNEWQFAQLFEMDTSGTNEIQLTVDGDNRAPTWSPDGSMVAWSGNVALYTMNIDGGNVHFLHYGNGPSWSINDQIVFSFASPNYKKEVLYIINSDGSNLRQITD